MDCGRCGSPAELTIPLFDRRSYRCVEVPVCRACYEGYSPRIGKRGLEWRRSRAVSLHPPLLILSSRRAALLLSRVIDRALHSTIVRALISSAPYVLLAASAAAACLIAYTTIWYLTAGEDVGRVRAFYRSNPLAGTGVVGLDPALPLLEVAIALMVAMTIHEAAHAAVLRMYGHDVRRVGLILLGPIPVGAFVEPPGNLEYRMPGRQLLQLAGAGIAANLLLALASLGAVLTILAGVEPLTPEALAAAARVLESPWILIVPPALLSIAGVATPMSAPEGWYTHAILGPQYALPLSIAQHMFILNLMIGVLNALPAKPFDGGFVIQALLGERLGLRRADMLSTTLTATFMASILLVVVVARV